jgi:hypothetical protein
VNGIVANDTAVGHYNCKQVKKTIPKAKSGVGSTIKRKTSVGRRINQIINV